MLNIYNWYFIRKNLCKKYTIFITRGLPDRKCGVNGALQLNSQCFWDGHNLCQNWFTLLDLYINGDRIKKETFIYILYYISKKIILLILWDSGIKILINQNFFSTLFFSYRVLSNNKLKKLDNHQFATSAGKESLKEL